MLTTDVAIKAKWTLQGLQNHYCVSIEMLMFRKDGTNGDNVLYTSNPSGVSGWTQQRKRRHLLGAPRKSFLLPAFPHKTMKDSVCHSPLFPFQHSPMFYRLMPKNHISVWFVIVFDIHLGSDIILIEKCIGICLALSYIVAYSMITRN